MGGGGESWLSYFELQFFANGGQHEAARQTATSQIVFKCTEPWFAQRPRPLAQDDCRGVHTGNEQGPSGQSGTV